MAIEGKDSLHHTLPEGADTLSAQHTPGDDSPGFDQDSPDLADPQVDPTHPAKPPAGPVDDANKRAEGDSYPPYDGEPE